MRKTLSAALATLFLALPAAAQPATPGIIEANQATEAQLDGVNGLGPATTRRILAARGERPFDGWRDLIARVKGIGPASAARLSQQGLRVAGQPYGAAPEPAPPAGR
ncbi:helix-hairpin-helix domain-containing protein [Pulveribacter sp.]|uniref:ComEA family DNA-binding protein n=1 Tax=Pulveribacter sp. TaxID=2678893 RepID=UPI0028AD071D|nr:helix-hairpin-helix domain-containing protein [Pulveribacter sp.]